MFLCIGSTTWYIIVLVRKSKAKVEFTLEQATKARGGWRYRRYSSALSLTSALDGLDGQRPALAALPPGRTRYLLYRRLGGPQGRSGRVRKISPPPGFDPRTVQPIARHYTDCAIPALIVVRIVTLLQTVRVCRGCWPWATSEGDYRPEWRMLISLISDKHMLSVTLKLYYFLVKLANRGCELSIKLNELRTKDLTLNG